MRYFAYEVGGRLWRIELIAFRHDGVRRVERSFGDECELREQLRLIHGAWRPHGRWSVEPAAGWRGELPTH